MAQFKLTPNHHRLEVGGHDVFIRVVVAPPEQDLTDALDAAQPMEGEVVMNTHFVGETEEEWAARGDED
jgi:hypothetical protein